MALATIEKIENKRPHPNGDRLDLVDIKGYQCITEKGLYENGDIVIYIRTDTVLPQTEWAEGYRKYCGRRVKAINLRKEWSEGIIVPFYVIYEHNLNGLPIGTEVSEIIGVTKYVDTPKDVKAISNVLPYGMSITDEKRWEEILEELPNDEVCDVTLKIDGTSTTQGHKLDEDRIFVSNRNNELNLSYDNEYIKVFNEWNIEKLLKDYSLLHNISISLRGEVYGGGIQSSSNNPHSSIKGVHIAYFSVYLIDERRYAEKGDRFYFINVCKELGLPTVPLIEENVKLSMELIRKYSNGVKIDGYENYEGVVIKHSKGSFKVINKKYDSKK